MADTITVKQLASKAGVEPRVLRKLLRSQFPRTAKGKLYSWNPDDPQIELILKAVDNGKPEAKPKVEKPKAKKAPARTKAKAEKPAAEAKTVTG